MLVGPAPRHGARPRIRDDGRYASVAAIRPLRAGQRTFFAPTDPPGLTTCRVTRSGRLIATMRLRRVG